MCDAVVSPTVPFGLPTLPLTKLPLTKTEYETLNKLQHKILRLVVGWARHAGEDW